MGAAATDVRSFSYWEQLQKTCADAASVSSCSYWQQLQQMCAAATSLHSCYICAQLQFCAQLQQEQLQQLAVRCYRSTQPRLSLNRLTVVNRERGREKGNMS